VLVSDRGAFVPHLRKAEVYVLEEVEDLKFKEEFKNSEIMNEGKDTCDHTTAFEV
jgi:hypothetical protein